VSALLDKRLVFVAGKGGVGKSTVAAALGMAAARRGRRTIVVEVAQQDRIARSFGHDDSHFSEVELDENLWTISLDPRRALEEYLHLQVRVGPLADLLGSSRMFQYFAAATPGMSEMVTMGKIWELAQLERRTRGGARYDLVIVDSPATGHGLAIMRTPKTFADVARVGPVAHQGRTIHAMIADPRSTGVVAVCIPQEMPVNETLMLRDELAAHLGLDLDVIVLNGVYPDRFSDAEADRCGRAAESAGTPAARAALAAALSAHVRARRQGEEAERLESATGQAAVRLPFLFAPEVSRPELAALSERLESAL